jgi:hypothetical protein
MKIFMSVFIAFILLTSCSDNISGSFPEGSYSYTGYDDQGNLIARGWISIAYSDSPSVQGEWDIKKIGTAKDIGPQVGSGKLTGGLFDSDSIWIELNPQFRDNNLQLRGFYGQDKISGQWQWITFAGVSNKGTFTARRY